MYKLLVGLFLCSFNLIFSQVVKTNENESTIYQPKVIVFKPDDDSNNKEYTPEFRHMIKISPLMYFNGDFPIFYELRLGKNTSFEVALGITHKDFINEIRDEANNNGFSSSYYNETRENQFGNSFRAAFKYWPSKYGALDEGFYFSPELLFRNYKSSFYTENTSSTKVETNFYNQERIVKELRLLAGWVYYLDDNVFFEYFVGVGLADVNTKYSLNGAKSPDLNSQKSKPNYILGAKLGFSL